MINLLDRPIEDLKRLYLCSIEKNRENINNYEIKYAITNKKNIGFYNPISKKAIYLYCDDWNNVFNYYMTNYYYFISDKYCKIHYFDLNFVNDWEIYLIKNKFEIKKRHNSIDKSTFYYDYKITYHYTTLHLLLRIFIIKNVEHRVGFYDIYLKYEYDKIYYLKYASNGNKIEICKLYINNNKLYF